MIKVYEARSKEWFESVRFASQYYGCSQQAIKLLVNKGERVVNGKLIDFRDTDIIEDPKKKFIKENNLKYMLGSFYLSPDMKVWMWANRKKQWMEWKTIKFQDSGDVCFCTTIINGKLKSKKWVKVNHYYKNLFPEKCLKPLGEVISLS